MVLGETEVEGYSSSDGRYSGGNTASAYPASMDPGAIMSSQVETGNGKQLASLLQQVQEIRSHYTYEVRDRTLFLGYDINGAARGYALPFANLPLSGATAWLLYGGPMRTRVTSTFVIDTIRGAENLARRPLTQTEAEGYAQHASRRTMYSFASSISAVWIGSVLAIIGRKTMKFPFRKAQPLERYDNFPNRWLPVLKGSYARTAWQITRFNVYTILCLALIAPVYSSMGDSAMMVGLYKDQRTHEVTKGMAAALKNTRGRLKRHTSNSPKAAQGQYGSAGDTQDDNGFYVPSEQGSPEDDSGGREYISDASYPDGSSNADLPGDAQMQSHEAVQPSPSSFAGNSVMRQKSIRQQSPAIDSSADPDFIFDDASPTAANSSSANAGTGIKGAGTGSAWERVRTGQSDGRHRNSATTRASQQSSRGSEKRQTDPSGAGDERETNADSFSFSDSDRERQLAKEQAQREFDKMLEEERKGVDGSGVANGGGAWSRRRGL